MPKATRDIALAALPFIREVDPRWNDVNERNFEPAIYPAHRAYFTTIKTALE